MGSVLLAWSFCPGADRLEQNVYSVLMGLVPAASVPANTVVVTLNEHQKSATSVSYSELAQLLDRLKSAGGEAIGLMVPLDYSQTTLDDEGLATIREALRAQAKNKKQSHSSRIIRQMDPDASLSKTLMSSDRIVLAVNDVATEGLIPLAVEPVDKELATFMPSLATPPAHVMTGAKPLKMFSNSLTIAVFQNTVNKGRFTNVLAATPLAINLDNQYLPSFELLLAARALSVPAKSIIVHPGKGLMMGKTWVATDAGLRIYPRQQGSVISMFSASDVLAGKNIEKLRGKVVLVGLDSDQTVQLPGSHRVSQLQGIAHAVNALINKSLVKVPYWSLGLQRGGLVLVLIYLILMPVRLRGLIGLVGGLVLGFLILNGSLLMLTLKNTWLPLALPVLLLFTGQIMVWVHHRFAHSFSRVRGERDRALVELAAQMRQQGKMDKAFNYLKGCSLGHKNTDELVMDGLYQIGLEYERRRQFAKALTVYDHIASWNTNYRDISERRGRQQTLSKQGDPGSLAATMVSHSATTLVVDDPGVERPVLGRYEIERELGRGAMGTVYLGRDPRIGRIVAIKTLALTEEFDSTQLDDVRRRFFQEAETAGRLGHPNIVTIYDVGEEHDLAYIAMDFIQGDSLDQHIRNGELLPLKDVFTIGILVAEALDYAHTQSVVHRDVKPGNIIYDREKCQLKVTDFGIACLTDNSKTRTGTVLGSPYYMSPEQIAGKKVDGRSDLFSLGITLYQLFSGQLPFEGDSLTSLMYQITNEKPISVRKAQPDLPSCLTRVINKALEKNPLKRYVNGHAMAEALRRCAEQSGAGYYNE